MAIDKEKAKELRLQGMSLQDVATALGCSLAWCKANLKGVKKVNKDKPIIDEIRKMGRSKLGTTSFEIRKLVVSNYGYDAAKQKKEIDEKVIDLKRAAKRSHKDVVIRPYWLLPTSPQDCSNTMMDMAQDIHEHMYALATKYRKLYDLDHTYQNSVVYYLSMLSAGTNSALMPQGLATFGKQLGHMIDELEQRNPKTRLLFNSIHYTESLSPSAVDMGISDGYQFPEERVLIEMDELDLPY